jgi:hypothetical protein
MYKTVDVNDLYKERDGLKAKYPDSKEYNKEYNKLLKRIQYWSDADFRMKKNLDTLERNSVKFGTDEYRTYQREYHRIYRKQNTATT